MPDPNSSEDPPDGPADALAVRIACRDADRPHGLEAALGKILGHVEG